jgi:glycosyltransferase involved in cell wall biosynthesis
MDVCADELYRALMTEFSHRVTVELARWPIPRRLSRLARSAGWMLDRMSTRYVDYPVGLLAQVPRFDAFHIVDHSYGHLALALPSARTGVFVHDLDAFANVSGRGSLPRRLFSYAALAGTRRCPLAFYSTVQVGRPLGGLVPDARLVHAPYGFSSEFRPSGPDHRPISEPYVLNVSADLPRKRMDLLLQVFASVRRRRPGLVLVQRGASIRQRWWTSVQRLGLEDAVVDAPRATTEELAGWYRGAEAVVLASDSEGFGLPLLEALACGTPVACTDIPAFREVGGNVPRYGARGNAESIAEAVLSALDDGRAPEVVAARVARSRGFSWIGHARTIVEAYEALVEA